MFEDAVAALAGVLGRELERADAAELFGDANIEAVWALLAGPELLDMLGGREASADRAELLYPGTAAFAAWGAEVGIDAYLAARRRRAAITDVVRGVLGSDGVVVSPTMCADAMPAGGPDRPGDDVDLGLYDNLEVQNLTGFPAILAPGRRARERRPLRVAGDRVQPNREDLLIAVAEAWEAARPWPPTAPGYEPFALEICGS